MCPRSVDVKDNRGHQHTVDVEILGVEETWQTASLLLAVNKANNGRAIFSQVEELILSKIKLVFKYCLY